MRSSSNQIIKNQSLEILTTYQKNPSPQIRNRLVDMNIGLVRREAQRWLHNSGETFDDMMQVDSIGLIRAIERFDLQKG